MRAGVVEFVALEPDLRALAGGRVLAERLGQSLGIIKRARPADIMFEQILELGGEGGIGLGRAIGDIKLEHERHQRLGDIAAAELAEMPAIVGLGAEGIWEVHGGCALASHPGVSSCVKSG